jgi:hypothetical protein
MHQKTSAAIVVLGIVLVTGMFVTADSQDTRTARTYFDGRQMNVSLKELEPADAASIIARSSPLYSVYSSDGCEPEGHVFVKVLDSISSDGTSTLWRGVQIEFNPGYPCHQFTSDEEIAAAVKSGEISLVPTGYVYRCRVLEAN